MRYVQAICIVGVVVTILQPGVGKKECPVKPPGISSFRPVVGTRLYYAWSTVQGTAKKSFLSNTLCRGGRILDCSCVGYDVVGYDKTSVELEQGYTFAVNKKLGVADLYHFTRTWSYSGDYHLKCHYTTDYQYGNSTKGSYKKSSKSTKSYSNVWNSKNASAVQINKYSGSLKVLMWTSTEVVFYDCASTDPDIRIYTSYIPKSKSEIPYSVFDVLSQVGININSLRWLKLDHKKCVYPDKSTYAKLVSKKKYVY